MLVERFAGHLFGKGGERDHRTRLYPLLTAACDHLGGTVVTSGLEHEVNGVLPLLVF